MIVVCVTKEHITLDGHAGYAEHGHDIVCAAVSALAQNLAASMEALTLDEMDASFESGHIEIVYKDLSEQGRLLVDSFFIGVCEISRAYPDHVVVTDKPPRRRALSGIREGGTRDEVHEHEEEIPGIQPADSGRRWRSWRRRRRCRRG